MANKSNNYWDKRALKRLDEAEKSSEEYIKRIKRLYDKANKDIERELESVYRNYSKNTGLDVQKLKELLTRSQTKKLWEQMKRQGLDKYIKNNYKARISRLEEVQAQIYAKAKQIYPKEELEQTMAYKGIINDSYYKAVYDTQMGTKYDFNFSKIDKNLMDTILNERWSGKNYSERIWGNTDILAESLSEVVGGALMSGQSIQKTTKQIKDRFNVSKYYAERLVRTETNHFNNMADAMAYEEMGVEKYVFVATLDNRTSAICQSMDGKKFAYKDKQEGINYPPLHPNCRSKTRGYLGEEEEKMLKRRARNLKTGKTEIIDNISYEEWAKQNGLLTDKPAKKPAKTTEKVAKLDIKERKEVLKTFEDFDIQEITATTSNLKQPNYDVKTLEKIRQEELTKNNLDYEKITIMNKQGNILDTVGGDNRSANLSDEQLKLSKNNILTHNHPVDYGFSTNDIYTYLNADMYEIRATTSDKIYSLKKGTGEVDGINMAKQFIKDKPHAPENLYKEIPNLVESGIIPDDEDVIINAKNYLTDKWLKEKAEKYGYKYQVIDIKNDLAKDLVNINQKSDIITPESFIKDLNITSNDYKEFGKVDPYDNDIQEQLSEKLNLANKPKVVNIEEYNKTKGKEIVRVVHEWHGKTVNEVYKNTLYGRVKYSESFNSSYGRGIYFGDKSSEEHLIKMYGRGDKKLIYAKIPEDFNILEFEDQAEYIKAVSDELAKVSGELISIYQNEPSLLFMIKGLDGIKIKSNGYYCIYNRGKLIILE